MLSLGSLAFASPWILLALASLPVLWWLLRVTPPAPKLIRFPAIRLLFKLRQDEETPAHTPWWLLLLRLAIAGFLILALAHPLLNPREAYRASGPVLLVVDNGWASAPRWDDRRRMMTSLLDQAEREDRKMIVLATAPPADGAPLAASKLLRAADARTTAQSIKPVPWPADHAGARKIVEKLKLEGSVNAVWLTTGLSAADTGDETEKLAKTLQGLGSLRLLADAPVRLAHLIDPPVSEGRGLKIRVRRAHGEGEVPLTIAASEANGRILARRPLVIPAGDTSATLLLDLPTDIRNRIGRIQIEAERGAGAVALVDERWRRRPVGVVSSEAARRGQQPLLSNTYYIDRALKPFSEIRADTIGKLIESKIAVLVLADSSPVTPAETTAVEEWVKKGGMLVRFAGPRLAAANEESATGLLPVRLRRGGRSFGGAMSWTVPAKLAPFDDKSPFAGLEIPGDVTVSQQVLAEPAADLAERTWARLADGTPLVTASREGSGWIVLFHTTANADWSNLVISGLFVEMLQRLLELSRGVDAAAGTALLPPQSSLDGFGRLVDPLPAAAGLSERDLRKMQPGPRHPPGLYGNQSVRRAFNLGQALKTPVRVESWPAGVVTGGYGDQGETDLQPWLFGLIFLLFLADMLISLIMRGLVSVPVPARKAGAAAAIVLAAFLIAPTPGDAQSTGGGVTGGDKFAIDVTSKTHLAYIRTGNPEIDGISQAGLAGLSQVLYRRTAVEPGKPVGVNLESDELAFFPILYWPITPEQRTLSEAARTNLSGYLKRGGLVLIDTRSPDGGDSATRDTLRRLVQNLKIPALEPVPDDHVLTRAFYLLQRFPGRWDQGQVWVERRGRYKNDGVSAIVIGSNDWAAAWATDAGGRPMFAAVPGGAAQREHAFRFGVNIVMYALTGNYKADQVHIPTILERLGQ